MVVGEYRHLMAGLHEVTAQPGHVGFDSTG